MVEASAARDPNAKVYERSQWLVSSSFETGDAGASILMFDYS